MVSSNPRPKICGIYAIHSEVNGRTYVGQSSNIPVRWYRHRLYLRNGEHDNPHLQNAWNLYGPEAFEFSVIEECPVDQLLIREQFHMDLCPDNYNICPAAGSRLGATHTAESRGRMRAAKIGNTHRVGRVHTSESRSKMSASHTGLKATDESRAINSAAQTGRKHTSEAKEKMRVAALAREARKREARASAA